MAATGSALDHLSCPKCSARADADVVHHLCGCGSPLLARYDLELAAATLRHGDLGARGDGLWRWRELLPVRDDAHHVSLGERSTPIVPLQRIGELCGLHRLAFKDEGMLPTGSFKARGAAIGVSRAKELGVLAFAMPTNGNAGGAWSAYGRRAGLEAHIAMPKAAPIIHRMECECTGARVTLVDGVISDAGKVVAGWVREQGLYDASTLKEPYRIEGKKTLGFEIVEQYGWDVPDVVLYPTGGGVGLIGIDKGLEELRGVGLLGERRPRLVAVQASGCAPIVRAWSARARESEFWEHSVTAAFGINVPKAIGDFLVLDAIYASDGCAVGVDDSAILEMRARVAAEEGVLLCPEGAATIAAAALLRSNGWIRDGERVLAINTGSGLKYPFS